MNELQQSVFEQTQKLKALGKEMDELRVAHVTLQARATALHGARARVRVGARACV